MATKHTCNNGNGPVFGKRQPYGSGCARCDELTLGAAPVVWSSTRRREIEAKQIRAIRAHDCKTSKCGPVCTAFES